MAANRIILRRRPDAPDPADRFMAYLPVPLTVAACGDDLYRVLGSLVYHNREVLGIEIDEGAPKATTRAARDIAIAAHDAAIADLDAFLAKHRG